MKKSIKNDPLKKPTPEYRSGFKTSFDKNRKVTATGTCLGDCVKCGASCCMDAGHPGPHFCYLCK
jgi:hypothetical protein